MGNYPETVKEAMVRKLTTPGIDLSDVAIYYIFLPFTLISERRHASARRPVPLQDHL